MPDLASIQAREPRIIGVYGQFEWALGSEYLQHGIKTTKAYNADPSDQNLRALQRDTEVIAPHASRVRFEARLGKNPPIFMVPHGEQGPQWDAMRRIAVKHAAGKTAVGRRIFFSPLPDAYAASMPPAEMHTSAFLELLSAHDSLNQRLPSTEMRHGGTMVVLALGEEAIGEVSLGYTPQKIQRVFDPSPVNNRILPPQERDTTDPYLVEHITQYLIITADNNRQ